MFAEVMRITPNENIKFELILPMNEAAVVPADGRAGQPFPAAGDPTALFLGTQRPPTRSSILSGLPLVPALTPPGEENHQANASGVWVDHTADEVALTCCSQSYEHVVRRHPTTLAPLRPRH